MLYTINFRSDADCQKYFMCIEGRPRVLFCGENSGYDELTSTCVSADEVPTCPSELRTAAARARDDEQQRLAKELEFSKFNNQNAQRKRPFY